MGHSGIIATVESESRDRINELPDAILSSILPLLRIREAVESSMVSCQ
jgi:hypothetical protein